MNDFVNKRFKLRMIYIVKDGEKQHKYLSQLFVYIT